MQIIVGAGRTPEEYVRCSSEQRVRPPVECPQCGQSQVLAAHGYYRRHTTDQNGRPTEIRVRRFRCKVCGSTLSCLPSFAQPYRLLSSATVERGFRGDVDGLDVSRNGELLRRYWRRFKEKCQSVGRLLGLDAIGTALASRVWAAVLQTAEGFGEATQHLVSKFMTTCFGQYRCHRGGAPP